MDSKAIDKLKYSGLNAARITAAELREVASRLEAAIDRNDLEALSEITISAHAWTVDEIRGLFRGIVRIQG